MKGMMNGMISRIPIVALTLVTVSCLGSTPGARAGDAASGAKVYEEQKCRLCHSIAEVGNKRNPLDGVGDRLDEATIRKWLVTPQEMDPKVKKKSYGELPAEQLDALVAYVKSLKAAE